MNIDVEIEMNGFEILFKKKSGKNEEIHTFYTEKRIGKKGTALCFFGSSLAEGLLNWKIFQDSTLGSVGISVRRQKSQGAAWFFEGVLDVHVWVFPRIGVPKMDGL